jgi:SAM-dependent methyltransferase
MIRWKMILDIGCGVNPRGDVNVDLPIGGDHKVHRTKANIYASAYFLPFRDKCFEVVSFNGLLHHLERPKTAWNEMVRVCKDVILGVEPNWNLWFPRDHTEFSHGYRIGSMYQITRPSTGFSVWVERKLHFSGPPRTELRIIALRNPLLTETRNC